MTAFIHFVFSTMQPYSSCYPPDQTESYGAATAVIVAPGGNANFTAFDTGCPPTWRLT
ncbi:MAG TPA: hypothetical protein VL356_12840 [Acidocella sp.]|jgi:hypothetical protein|nr:hypothetical protein [Acidocella sp.]